MAFEMQSPGGAFSDAFTQSLLQQEQLRRQKMLDEITKRDKESVIETRKGQLENDRINAESMSGYRQAQVQDDIARGNQIEAANAQNIKDAAAENAFGMFLDENPTATDSDMRKFLVQAGMSMAKVNATVTGAANIARDKARLAQGDKLAADADKRARDLAASASDDRRYAADLAHQDRQANTEQNAANKAATAQEKSAAKAEVDQRAAMGVLDQVDSIDNTLKQILTTDKAGHDTLTPGAASTVGGIMHGAVPAVISRTFGNIPGTGGNADAQASIDRLSSQMIINLITEMKSASKTGATGFGQLSDNEGKILSAAAAQLAQYQSGPQFVKALQQVRDSINRIRVHAQDRMKSGADALKSGVVVETPGAAAPAKKSKYVRVQSSIEN